MTNEPQEALARSAVYESLSLAFLYPEEGSLAHLSQVVRNLERAVRESGKAQLRGAVEAVADRLDTLDEDGFEIEFIDIFGHTISNDCSPYEGEYGQAHVFQKSGVLADLSSFYAAFGVKPNPELKDRVDHISVELEFMQLLTAKEAYAHLHGHGEDKVLLCREAQANFLENHLGQWVHSFAKHLAAKAGNKNIYGPLAHLLNVQLNEELNMFALDGLEEPLPSGPEPEGDDSECGAISMPVAADPITREGGQP